MNFMVKMKEAPSLPLSQPLSLSCCFGSDKLPCSFQLSEFLASISRLRVLAWLLPYLPSGSFVALFREQLRPPAQPSSQQVVESQETHSCEKDDRRMDEWASWGGGDEGGGSIYYYYYYRYARCVSGWLDLGALGYKYTTYSHFFFYSYFC
jgi:hypothetical protein